MTAAAAKKKEVTIGGAVGVPPAGAVALRSLTMRNVLSFGAEATVELGALNVLIGANGCGKSNLMDVVALLKAAATTDLSDEFRGGAEDWVWNGVGKDKGVRTMGIVSHWSGEDGEFIHSMEVCAGDGRYSISCDENVRWKERPRQHRRVARSPAHFPTPIPTPASLLARNFPPAGSGGETLVKREDCQHSHSRNDRMSLLNPATPVYEDVGGFRRRSLSDIIKDVQVYRSRQVGRMGELSPLHRPSRTDMPIDRLSETLDNFALVLNRVRLEREDEIVKALRDINEDARGLDIRVGNNRAEVVLKEKGGNIPAHRMSDGMLNWLFLLTVLLDPKPPALACIDEPETGMHPDMFSALTKLLVDASKRMQLIVTTHSGGIVDALADTPEAILVCDKTEEGTTTLHRLNAEEVRDWEEEGLGMAWASGAIGGTRW